MSITITVAPTVAREAFERIEALAQGLPETDPNFEGLVIRVERHDFTGVRDPHDELRAAHLLHLVEDAIESETSHFGALQPSHPWERQSPSSLF
jgi:hypothetical protein